MKRRANVRTSLSTAPESEADERTASLAAQLAGQARRLTTRLSRLALVVSDQLRTTPHQLTTLQQLVVVPMSAGPHTFIGAGAHSFDPQSLLDVVPAVATTVIGVVRKTPPIKKRKAEATCPDSPLRPPRDRSGGPLCTGRGSSRLQVP